MQLEAKKLLLDIVQAAEFVTSFSRGKTLTEYRKDPLLRSAIERQLTILGEAIAKLAKVDAQTAASLTHYRGIVAFRNVLVHGYAEVDDEVVWGIVESDVLQVKDQAQSLLRTS